MEAILTLIGILALGALVIMLCVFVAAARRYVSEDVLREEDAAIASDFSPYREWQQRAGPDRMTSYAANTRGGEEVEDERSVAQERRVSPRSGDRRAATDRRTSAAIVEFPLQINGRTIARDRRSYQDRRSRQERRRSEG